MKIRRKNSGMTLADLLVIYVIAVVIMAVPLAFWTQRNLDFWFSYHKQVPVHVPFYLDLALSIFLPLTFVGNLAGEIARYLT